MAVEDSLESVNDGIGESEHIEENLERQLDLTITDECDENEDVNKENVDLYKLGFTLNEFYELSLDYYKKVRTELSLSYFHKVQLVALWKQITLGQFSQSKCPEIGFFDVVGNDRKNAWIALADMSPDVAKQQFCKLLEENCPSISTFLSQKRAEIDAEIEQKRLEEEAQLKLEDERLRKEEEERLQKEEEERLRKEEEERLRLEEEERLKKEEEERIQKEEERLQKEEEERLQKEEEERLQKEEERLCEEEEERLLLEEEDDCCHEGHKEEEYDIAEEEELRLLADDDDEGYEIVNQDINLTEAVSHGNETSDASLPDADPSGKDKENTMVLASQLNGFVLSNKNMIPASLWTRPKVQEFINHVKRDASSILVVGRGETVTVSVPTHALGSCLFWEFATEQFDVGFGVYFEWSGKSKSGDKSNLDCKDGKNVNEQQVIINENEDNVQVVNKSNTDEVLPVLRRNSHEQVIIGSHMYPGVGTYLLKFDNSYSLVRSKTLYYRVYYTK